MDLQPLFTDDDIDVSPFDPYPLGSYWEIKYDRGDGDTNIAKGVIYEHSTWNNQWRIDQYNDYTEKMGKPPMWGKPEEYQEEPQLHMYTGYSFGVNHFGSRIWISRIKKATRIYGASIERLQTIWQGHHDRWSRNDVKHAEWWAHPGTVHVGWEPKRWDGPCDHMIWRTKWSDTYFVVTCVCDEVLDHGVPDEPRCLWWTYTGSMGEGRKYVPHDSSSCEWCRMRKERESGREATEERVDEAAPERGDVGLQRRAGDLPRQSAVADLQPGGEERLDLARIWGVDGVHESPHPQLIPR